MSIDTAAGILAGQMWRERRTGRVISIIDADSVYAGGGRVRYKDQKSGRRNSLLIHALQERFDKVEEKAETEKPPAGEGGREGEKP